MADCEVLIRDGEAKRAVYCRSVEICLDVDCGHQAFVGVVVVVVVCVSLSGTVCLALNVAMAHHS